MTGEPEVRRLIEAAQRIADLLTVTTLPEDMRAAGYRFAFDTAPLPVLKAEARGVDRWCLHKDHDDWADVTTFGGLGQGHRVYLARCGGIRREAEQ